MPHATHQDRVSLADNSGDANKEHTAEGVISHRALANIRLPLKVLFVGIICALSTEVGFANKIPPHDISALWPTIAILFAVLVATPLRHWWLYIAAAYAASLLNDASAGFPTQARWYVAAGVVEVLVAALGVRYFANGIRSFNTLRSLVAYLAMAVVLAPVVGAFIAARAGPDNYWYYWRVWFLSESLAYLVLAPVILSWMELTSRPMGRASARRVFEAGIIACGLALACLGVFLRPSSLTGHVPALVYLPLPFVLWAAVRFGPPGVNTALFVIAVTSISGAVDGLGPFFTSGTNENVLSLQMYLFVSSLPLIVLATLIVERQNLEAEAALQRQELAHLMQVSTMGQLSGSIAHEINQPLGAIRVNAEAALKLLTWDSPDLGKIREVLHDIVADEERAVGIIHRLRNLMKKRNRSVEHVNVNELIDTTLAVLHNEFAGHGVTVEVDTANNLPTSPGDPVQLQQVLLNLLINAIDAMASTPVDRRVVTVSTGVTQTGAIRVEVRDTGPGIGLADHSRLFDPFYTTKDNGLGLGLSISSTIVQAHGGKLSLADGEAGGAIATILLPAPLRQQGQASLP
ncbi:MAG: MASE1 domain-containing protein [Mesorhizobium sp.]|jgi:signal transduction histidine kinase